VAATNAPTIERQTFDLGPFALRGAARDQSGRIVPGIAPRRSVLDHIPVEAAVAAGADLHERFAVEGLTMEDGRVTGIRGRTNGVEMVESARIVIGADGIYSRVARAVDAPSYRVRPAMTGAYWSYFADVPLEDLEVYPREGRVAVAFPTNDGLACVAGQWRRSEMPAIRADIEGSFADLLELAPSLGERVRGGRRVTPWEGRFDLHNFLRRPYGAGWALVGDAGYMRDPINGQGIGDAFRDAGLLAEAIDDGFAGRRPIGDALAEYERRRNEAIIPMYDFICQLATLEAPAPPVQELFGALRWSQVETDRFFSALAGTASLPEFFAPQNVERIVRGALAAAA
jgi:flavin-dependent dehydrogenase